MSLEPRPKRNTQQIANGNKLQTSFDAFSYPWVVIAPVTGLDQKVYKNQTRNGKEQWCRITPKVKPDFISRFCGVSKLRRQHRTDKMPL